MKMVFLPSRLLMMVPILYLQTRFEDATLSLFFGVFLAIITAKLFPWAIPKEEFDKLNKKLPKDSNDSNDPGN